MPWQINEFYFVSKFYTEITLDFCGVHCALLKQNTQRR